ncbi:MAG: hypothetical protein IPM31_04080 [Anaerolineae bacterium]|nr:hypothetical protein [Anaerolineae bacterium]MBL8104898.1 hypothetical protein [Anaerolineales bacterium]MCC7189859.1 hypothetical protein [Anaerolineales bacterium]
MDIAEFRSITMTVIRESGIADYIPTLILPAEGVVMALEGIPSDISHEDAARQWIRENGYESAEYFLAFRAAGDEIYLEHRKDNLLIGTAVIDSSLKLDT